MNFKNDVLFYLSNINNIREEEDEETSDEGGEASCKTVCPECGKKKCTCKKSVRTKTVSDEDSDDYHGSEASCSTEECPECGKKKCTCKKSVRTKTVSDEDSDDYHGKENASVKGEPPADFGNTKEEREMLKLMKRKNQPAEDFGATKEEREMLKLAKKRKEKSCVKTMKESIMSVNNTVNGITENIVSEEIANTKITNDIKNYYKKLFK